MYRINKLTNDALQFLDFLIQRIVNITLLWLCQCDPLDMAPYNKLEIHFFLFFEFKIYAKLFSKQVKSKCKTISTLVVDIIRPAKSVMLHVELYNI